MNRGVAQTARLLGVDSTQVKTWASTFGDYLSTHAKPPKGSARTFSDSDVLVLAYVSACWEADPDLESIRTGLNGSEHHAQEFRELLYRHTPLLQEPPDDLDETWRHGVLLLDAWSPAYLELARSYRSVADNLLDTALKGGEPLDSAYPVLFAYRHTLELYLKLVGEIDESTHSLRKCVTLVEKRHGGKIHPTTRGWILELDEIDPRGTAFRYATPHTLKQAEYWLDLVQFKFAMTRVFEMLDRAIIQLGMKGESKGTLTP